MNWDTKGEWGDIKNWRKKKKEQITFSNTDSRYIKIFFSWHLLVKYDEDMKDWIPDCKKRNSFDQRQMYAITVNWEK